MFKIKRRPFTCILKDLRVHIVNFMYTYFWSPPPPLGVEIGLMVWVLLLRVEVKKKICRKKYRSNKFKKYRKKQLWRFLPAPGASFNTNTEKLKKNLVTFYNFQMLNAYCGHGILTYEPGILLKLYLLGRVQFKKKYTFDHPDSYMYVII